MVNVRNFRLGLSETRISEKLGYLDVSVLASSGGKVAIDFRPHPLPADRSTSARDIKRS